MVVVCLHVLSVHYVDMSSVECFLLCFAGIQVTSVHGR